MCSICLTCAQCSAATTTFVVIIAELKLSIVVFVVLAFETCGMSIARGNMLLDMGLDDGIDIYI